VHSPLASALPRALSLDIAEPRPAAPGPASEDGLRIALRLRDVAARSGRLLLFVPASSGDSVERLVYETTRGLEQLGEGPILILDLRHDASDGGWLSRVPTAAGYHAGPSRGADADRERTNTCYAQPVASTAGSVPYLASPEFAALVAAARRDFAYVMCAVGPISEAIESLVAAALCDGVVLSVTAHRTTIAEVQTASRQLASAHAPVLGFVVNRETAGRTV
jgi:hypothetical protein